MKPLLAPLISSSETQGQIKGARESLNERKNIYGTKKSKERREEPLGTMSYQTSSKRSPPFWLLISARKTQIFWHQSEARTTATVWNWSGKTLHCPQGLFSPILLPTICPWVSEDALIFANFANLTAPIALFLNTFNNRSSKEKKKRNCCGRDFPISFFFFKYGRWRPSCRWYWCPVICFSWTYFLTPYLRIAPVRPAFLWGGRGNFHADVRFIVLLAYPSDNYCVGAAYKRSKMD